MKSCFFGFLASLLLLVALVLGVVLLIPAPDGGGDENAGFTTRLRELGERISQHRKAAPKLRLPPSRTWTNSSGKTIEGVLISVSEGHALIRTVPQQRVYRIPKSTLSESDRAYLLEQASSAVSHDWFPPVAERWPPQLNNSTGAKIGKDPHHSNQWLTDGYRLKTVGNVDEEIVTDLAGACEGIRRSVQSVPLPLTWGRPSSEKRPIILYDSHSTYCAKGGRPEWAGHCNLLTGEVHISAQHLTSADFRKTIGQFSLKKRQKFDVLIHELVHQASLGIMFSGSHVWVSEGVAEFFSATQTSVGQFSFRDTQSAVKTHINESLNLDGLVEFKTLRLEFLRDYWDRDLSEFNAKTGQSEIAGSVNYISALILVEHFTFGENNALRPYLEAILSGGDRRKASSDFLQRGCSFSEIEKAIAARWKNHGLQILFVDNPSQSARDFEYGVGADSRISTIRGGL